MYAGHDPRRIAGPALISSVSAYAREGPQRPGRGDSILAFRRRSLHLLGALALLAVTAGCSGDDDPTAAPGASTTATATSSATATPEPDAPVVVMVDFAYDPAEVTVAVGVTLQVRNADSAPHTITAVDGSFDTGAIIAGASGTLTVASAGQFDFRCTLHPSMTGVLTVL